MPISVLAFKCRFSLFSLFCHFVWVDLISNVFAWTCGAFLCLVGKVVLGRRSEFGQIIMEFCKMLKTSCSSGSKFFFWWSTKWIQYSKSRPNLQLFGQIKDGKVFCRHFRIYNSDVKIVIKNFHITILVIMNKKLWIWNFIVSIFDPPFWIFHFWHLSITEHYFGKNLKLPFAFSLGGKYYFESRKRSNYASLRAIRTEFENACSSSFPRLSLHIKAYKSGIGATRIRG